MGYLTAATAPSAGYEQLGEGPGVAFGLVEPQVEVAQGMVGRHDMDGRVVGSTARTGALLVDSQLDGSLCSS